MAKTRQHPSRKKTVALVSFGCAKNLVDSEVMLGYLAQAGYIVLPDPGRADIVILNTCGFIRPAREEAESAIRDALRLKRTRRRRCRAPLLVVAGCYVERYKDTLPRDYPGVDVWLDVKDFDKIIQAIEGRPFRPGRRTFLCSHTTPRLLSTPRSWAYLKISEGCSHRCSFCAIPFIKGPYRSRPMASILREAWALSILGAKEINLISQDSTAFGRDLGMRDGLARLLEKLAGVPGVRWIRVLYGYPEEVGGRLLGAMTDAKVCPYLDIPFQHADPALLRRMGRSMDDRRALRLIERIRRQLPGVALRTSLIVGFPGEGRREFARLKRFVREASFDHLGIFPYSPEEGTRAFSLGDSVPEDVKLGRQREIMAMQAEISRAINRKYVGSSQEVLIESPGRADASAPTVPPTSSARTPSTIAGTGRTRFQAPEVDGIVLVHDGRFGLRPLAGIEEVEITAADGYDLHGKIVR